MTILAEVKGCSFLRRVTLLLVAAIGVLVSGTDSARAADGQSTEPARVHASNSRGKRVARRSTPQRKEVRSWTAPLSTTEADGGILAAPPSEFMLPASLDSNAVHVFIDEHNHLPGSVHLLGAEYFLNDERLPVGRDGAATGSAVARGTTHAGTNTLRVLITAVGRPSFAPLGPGEVTATVDRAFTFEAPEGGDVNIDVGISRDGNFFKCFQDRITVGFGVAGQGVSAAR
jgi:hypothetical protein